jgi:hypothetical protein
MNKYDRIKQLAKEIGDLVVEKNKAYGDAVASVGDALRLLFPQGIAPEQYNDLGLIVRIWDKLSRIANKKDAFGENPYKDIMGYSLLGQVVNELADTGTMAPETLPPGLAPQAEGPDVSGEEAQTIIYHSRESARCPVCREYTRFMKKPFTSTVDKSPWYSCKKCQAWVTGATIKSLQWAMEYKNVCVNCEHWKTDRFSSCRKRQGEIMDCPNFTPADQD